MIKFRDWLLSADRSAVLARQHDDMSRSLLIEGDFPEGYDWSLLVQCGDAMNIIALFPMEAGIGAVLTGDQLSMSGYYRVQLRGRKGEEVRHTNVISIYIPASMSGNGKWPEIPSEFTQMENRILEQSNQVKETLEELAEQTRDEVAEVLNHPPVPGEDNCWQIWNRKTGEYEPSGISMGIAQANWEQNDETAPDYVNGRTHWSETVATELVAERALQFGGSNELMLRGAEGGSPFPRELFAVGRRYAVEWNGAVYDCVLQEHNGWWCLGNLSVADESFEDTGESFCAAMLVDAEQLTTEGEWTRIMTMESNQEEALIRIFATETVCHKIAGKYLPEGTPWIEDGEKTYIVPETTIQFENGESIINGLIPFVVGELYTVRWNGAEYLCVAQDASSVFGDGAVGVGNGSVFGLAGNGEPFVIGAVPAYGATMLVALDGSSEAVGSVYQGGTTIRKLDNRCLDLAWLPTKVEGKGEEICPEVEKDMISYSGMHLASGTDTVGIELEANKAYIVVWEGTEYKCTAVGKTSTDYDGYVDVYLGNHALLGAAFGGTGEDTGEPFLIARSYSGHDAYSIVFIAGDGGEESRITRTVGIYAVGKIPNKLPAEFLPDNFLSNATTETPFFDFVEMGVPAHELGGGGGLSGYNFTDLCEALAAGDVKLRFSVSHSDGTVVTLTTVFTPVTAEIDGTTRYDCSMLYNGLYSINISATNSSVSVSSYKLSAA